MIFGRFLGSQRVPFSTPSLDFQEGRCEPVFTLPPTIDEPVGDQLSAVREPTMRGLEKLSERSRNPEVPVLVDVVDRDMTVRTHAQRNPRSQYRMIDWLSAIALLVISGAFVFAMERPLF